ncbi:MAG: hypothetical protein ACLTSZ_17180 [Lachnospiraceae bacterium]
MSLQRTTHLTISSMKAAKCVEAAILRGEPVDVYCSGTVQGAVPPELTLIQGNAQRNGARRRQSRYGKRGRLR